MIICSPFLYLRWHNSAEKTEDAFYTALANRDVSAIKKLTIHEDYSPITTTEAKAIVDLITTLGEIEVDQLFSPIVNNEVMNSYKMMAPTVSIAPLEPAYELEMPGVNPSKLVPGKYKVTVINDGILRSKYKGLVDVKMKNTEIPMKKKYREVNISNTYTFPLQAYNFIEISMNGKSTSLDEIIQNEPVDILDYKLPSYQIIGNWPWGKTKSSSFNFVDYISLDLLPYLDNKQENQLKSVLHKTLTDLSEGIVIQNYVTEHFKSFPPKLVKTVAASEKITAFNIMDLTVDSEETINGIYTTFSLGEDHFNAHFLYDLKNNKWQLNELSGSTIAFEDSTLFANSSNYTLARLHDIPMTALNDGQLKILFKNVYSISTSFPAKEVDLSRKPKVKNTIAACSKAVYYKEFKIQSIDVLNEQKAKVHSIDTCVDHEKYRATNLVIKNGYNDWQFQEIEPREKIHKH